MRIDYLILKQKAYTNQYISNLSIIQLYSDKESLRFSRKTINYQKLYHYDEQFNKHIHTHMHTCACTNTHTHAHKRINAHKCINAQV